jgi:hypothetical protein
MQRHHGQKGAGEQLESADQHPAGTGRKQRRPPAEPPESMALRKKAQIVDLLADLRQEREQRRCGHAER